MLAAKQKRKENIAEYILYMFQIEDLIRTFKLDMDLIETRLVAGYNVDAETRDEITGWYLNLVLMMEKEGLKEKGHLQFLNNIIDDIYQLHFTLLKSAGQEMYINTFYAVESLLNELKQKNSMAKNEVDLALAAVYGFLLLKMQNKEISPETTDAVKRISLWLSSLSKLYMDYEAGELEI